jgi:hypothetical protein
MPGSGWAVGAAGFAALLLRFLVCVALLMVALTVWASRGAGNKKPTTVGQPWVLCSNYRSRVTKTDGRAVAYNDYQQQVLSVNPLHLRANE